MSLPIRLLILGTGGMASNHANAYRSLPDVEIVAAVDTRAEVLDAFCREHNIPNQFETLDSALAWGQFDAASNVTPDAIHHKTSMALLAAGKHVLCEKPLASNEADANEMAETARASGLVNMVNLSYREVPALQHAANLVGDGALGAIKHFEASYLQSWLTQPAWGDWKTEAQWLWRLSTQHGSTGVLGDVGIHIIDFATFVAGSPPANLHCRLKTFDKAPGNQIGEYPLDANDSFVLHAELENGALGTISATRFASGHHNDLRLRLYGDNGGMEVLYENGQSQLRVCLADNKLTGKWVEVVTPTVSTNYESFVNAINNGTQAQPDFLRGAQLQHWIDAALSGG